MRRGPAWVAPVALAAAGLAFFVLAPWLTADRWSDPFADQYRAITPAMSPEEVTALVGPPTRKIFPGGSLGAAIYRWDGDGGRTIEVTWAERQGESRKRLIRQWAAAPEPARVPDQRRR